jgi:hypothetical protein
MHNAQALDKYVGSVSTGAAVCTGVCAKLAAGYTWTTTSRQPCTESSTSLRAHGVQLQLSADFCVAASCGLDAACTGLAQHWLLCMYRVCATSVYVYSQLHTAWSAGPTRVKWGVGLSNRSVTHCMQVLVPADLCAVATCMYVRCNIGLANAPSTVPQQNERVDVVELVLSGLRSACAAVRTSEHAYTVHRLCTFTHPGQSARLYWTDQIQ